MRIRPLIAAVIIPLFSLLFMATIFGNGKIENLPIGVADRSNTPLSQEIIRTVDASPTLNLQKKNIYSNEAQAKEAMQNMEIYGYFVIPNNFTQELYNGHTPTITYYYHYALLAVGGEVQGAFVKTLGQISTSLIDEYGKFSGTPTIKAESIALPTNGLFTSTYNSSLNYSTFLSYPFFFIFFQIFILVFTVYIIGTDMKKVRLVPYIFIFLAQTLLANFIFFNIIGIPLQGSLLALNIASILFVLSTMALGVAIIALIPKVPIAISIASMIGALGATASGVTFPLESMYPAFRAIFSVFPVRHFVLAMQESLYNNAGFPYSWENYAAMLCVIAVSLATIPLLKRAAMKDKGQPLPIMWGVALVMLGGSLGYGFLYGLLYHPNIVTDIPIAVIDKSESKISREFISNLNATQGVEIYAQCTDIPQGEKLIKEGKVKGIIFIPEDFNNRIWSGNQSNFAVWQTTESFLYYLTIQKATASTMQQLNNTLRTGTVKTLPLQQQLVLSQTPTFNANGVAIYNHTGGYGSYLLPIAIIVIIFQTMLMSGGILAGSRTLHPLRYLPPLIAGYFLLSIFLTGLIPAIFNLPALANPLELYLFMFLFILATAAFTGAVSIFFKDPEEVMLYVPFFSVGLIFLSGTSFPLTQIPHFWQIVHYFFPTSPAITGYVQLNSMGGTLQNAFIPIITLVAQTLIYGTIFTLYTRKIVHLHK